ncbi:MAG TPA: ABC transporter permease [Croceibacterium sp.]
MRDVLLVATREFRQIVATRGFWVMLLVVPLAIAVSGFASKMIAPTPGVAYTLVDPAGKVAPQIEARFERDHQRRVLRELSVWVDRWKLAAVDPAAPWAQRGSWVADTEVARFVAQGGADAALAKLQPKMPADATPFEVPEPLTYKVPPPTGVPLDRGPEAFGEGLAPALKEDVTTPAGEVPLALAIYIPENFGTPAGVARVWTNGQPNAGLIGTVHEELTAALRQQMLEANGLAPAAAMQVQALNAPLQITDPPAGEERSVIATGSLIPIALVYLLLITALTTGSMMLQGLVEERSNKLLESVLACVSPSALLQGKLLGLGGVGLGIITVWVGCAVGAAMFSTGDLADALRVSVEAIDEPWMYAAMLLYFLSGYLILSMVFLAIGSLSDSMQDAQSYLMPVLMLVMLPVFIMMQASLTDSDSVLTRVLSWIPLYTPFAMLARLGTGVSLAEVAGTSALLVVFIALELRFLGRLFEASVLNAGKPSWREVLAKLSARPAAGA